MRFIVDHVRVVDEASWFGTMALEDGGEVLCRLREQCWAVQGLGLGSFRVLIGVGLWCRWNNKTWVADGDKIGASKIRK
ncbi:hypothetical protein GOBAR_DD29841 [Gossypium barbadense]|nr:hypothetical protein GOBAR_DD29841 [Gossypium barbadense]